MSVSAYLRKTFLLYDALPVRELPPGQSESRSNSTSSRTSGSSLFPALLTDGIMPVNMQEANDVCRDLKFPPRFLWGTATAAYQIEGGLDQCNWSLWENQKTRRDGRPTVENFDRAGQACCAWTLFDQDLIAMKKLGIKMYRFSVEWSRIEPVCGTFDESALQRYKSWCQKLRNAGIEPMVTLHHFTEPAWFVEKRGWEIRDNIDYFQAFVERTTEVLAPHCRYWTTINELNGYAICGWIAGVHPPGKVNDFLSMLTVVRHLLVAHSRAARAIRAASATNSEESVICLALNHVLFLPFDSQQSKRRLLSWIGWLLSRMVSNIVALFLNYVYNFVFLDAIFASGHAGRFPLFPFPFHLVAIFAGWGSDIRALRATADWIGVNHYYRSYVQFGTTKERGPPNTATEGPRQASPTDMFIAVPFGLEVRATAISNFEKNEMGWDLTPSSMTRLVQILWDRYQPVPIIITESGTADATDQKRVRYIAAILCALHQLMMQPKSKTGSSSSGVDAIDIRGYLIWTLMGTSCIFCYDVTRR